jgi:hypothetical protein
LSLCVEVWSVLMHNSHRSQTGARAVSQKILRLAFGVAAACALSLMYSSAGSAQTQYAQATPATTGSIPSAPAKPSTGGSYYIEFRVAEIGAYGHSYVAYGRLNGNGRPADARYTDLHPVGNYALMAIGHVLPVPANQVWDNDVLRLPVITSYRHRLNASEYQRLLAAVKVAEAHRGYWNAITNNCNHYVAGLARAVGLRAPSDLQVSYAFVPALRDMNEGGRAARAESRPRTPAASRAPAEQPRS